MRRISLIAGFSLFILNSGGAFAVELDPCVTQTAAFKTNADAIRGQTAAAQAKFASWNDNPENLPADILVSYQTAVRDYAFGLWKDTAAGKGVLASWQPLADDGAAKAKFLTFVYSNEISPELEKKLAFAVFKKDYADNIKPKLNQLVEDSNKDIAANKAILDEGCSATVFAQFMRVTLGNAMIMVNDNFDASKRESGEVAAAVRAITGISITDILKNGIQGGEGSEVSKFNKMFEDVLDKNGMGSSTVAGQIFNAINPTKWSVTIPPGATTVKIDSDTATNVIKNTVVIVPVVEGYCKHNWCP
jgi:hypothetical protein